MCLTLALLVGGCSGGSKQPAGHAASANGVLLSIAPANGSSDTAPERGITVRAVRGRIGSVVVHGGGDRVDGSLNAAGTVWHSTWALNVSQRYTVTATATGASGGRVTRTSSFRTPRPRKTFSARVVEGYHQSYGVGMPIILYFN